MVLPKVNGVDLKFGEHELKPRAIKRLFIATVVISTIVALGMILAAMDIEGVRHISFSQAFKAQWISFKDGFISFVGSKSFPFVCSVIGALILGGGAIMISVSKRGARIAARINDKGKITHLIERKPGIYEGSSHYRRVEFREKDKEGITHNIEGYADYSGLDEEGSGLAPIYAYQAPMQNETVSILVIPGSIIRGAVGMVSNALLIVPLFFYHLFGYAYEKTTQKYIFSEEQQFKKEYILLQPCAAMWEVVRAPFYATAVIMAAVHAALIDPVNGRVLQQRIEEEWNFNPIANASTPINRGSGILIGTAAHHKFFGGGFPEHVNANNLYVAPCRQIQGYVEKKDGRIVAIWDRGFTNPNKFSIAIEHHEDDKGYSEASSFESRYQFLDKSDHKIIIHDPNEYFLYQDRGNVVV
jgi:hypothetical protein